MIYQQETGRKGREDKKAHKHAQVALGDNIKARSQP